MPLSVLPLILAALLFISCASTPQTRTVLKDPGALPTQHYIPNVPFFEQTENTCGPATLAMVSVWAGIQVTPEELTPLLVTPAKKGTLQLDYVGAARRTGLLAVTLTHLKSLLTEVSQNHPVVVLQNLGSSANPIWHYSVVHGYDLSEEEITLHSGKYQNLKMDLAQFERTWKGADYWALLVLPPTQLPSTSPLLEILLAASALERVGKNREANQAYQAILKKWPDQVGALFGLGNTEAKLGNYRKAATALQKAQVIEPLNEAILNNLKEVQKLRKRESL